MNTRTGPPHAQAKSRPALPTPSGEAARAGQPSTAGGTTSRTTIVARGAERALLTSLLVRPEIAGKVAALVRPEHFEDVDHRAVFVALLGVIADLGTCDVGTLVYRLARTGTPIDLARLIEITDAPNTNSWCARAHCDAVLEQYRRRRLAAIGGDLVDAARDPAQPIEPAIARVLPELEGLRGAPCES